jgi:Ca2+-binding RTX toxin-like protein
VRRFAVALSVMMLALPASASATSVLNRSGNTVHVTIQSANVTVTYSAISILFIDSYGIQSPQQFTDGSGCTADASNPDTEYTCNTGGLPTITSIAGSANADTVNGTCLGHNSVLVFTGNAGNDTVKLGGCSASPVNLGPGNDTATGGGTLSGQAGRDRLTGASSVDTLDGGDGRDLLIGGAGADTLKGGADPDTVSYEDKDGTKAVAISLDGVRNDGEPAENDLIGADVENVIGSIGGDTISGNAGRNDIDAGEAGDVVNSGAGVDFVDAGTGNDRIAARDGFADTIVCGAGDDQAVVDAFDTVEGCEDVQSSRALMPDVDADGVLAPADCNDGNAKIRPGLVDRPGNKVDEDCSGKDARFIRILSPVQVVFSSAAVTRVQVLNVLAVPVGGRVEMRCRGGKKKGCFKGVKRKRFAHGKDKASMLRPVKHSRLKPGAILEVRILAPDSVGRVVRFPIRRNAVPKPKVLCLVPGQAVPSKRCR